MDNIAKRLEEIREILDIRDKTQLGKIIDITPQAYNNYLRGRNPKKILYKYKKLFNIDPNWIMTGEGKMFLDGGIIDGEDYKRKEQAMKQSQEPTREYQILKSDSDIFDDELIDITVNKIKNLSNKNKKIAYHKISAIIEELS